MDNPKAVESHNVNDVCRICLRKIEDAICLFDDNHESKDILEKIYLCFQIIVNYKTYLPSSICRNCIEELDMANNFRLKCVTFEDRFSTYCSQEATQTLNLHEKLCEEYSQHNIPEDSHDGDEVLNSEPQPCIKNISPIQNNADEDQIRDCKFKCDICSKVLKTRVSLQKHNVSMHQKRKHVGKVTGTGINRRYHCTKCLYSTPHSQTLVNHMRRHDGERPYHCYCGKRFTQSSSLSAHQKTHSDNTYFVCSTCGKQFKHAFTLKNHLRVHEAGSFPCSICQKTLKTQQSLQEHMHRHYNIRNFNCEDCGATFVSCSDLLNHRKKHNSVKTAECHLCGYKTTAKKNLIVHLKRHAGDKAYKCELCAVTVYTSSELRRHRRVHARDKPFPCPACSQRFAHSPSLNKHVRNVHGVHYTWGQCKSKKVTAIT